MAVGGLHDGLIEPIRGLHIRPVDAVGDLHVRLRRLAAERAVDDGAGLSAGDLALGLERTVRVALDQPGVLRRGHIRREPVGRLHIGEIIIGRRTVVLREAHGDLRKLRAGDRCIRPERAVRVTADHAHVRKRGGRVVVPLVGRNVGEVILRRPVLRARIVVQQPEEDRRDLCARDLPVRTNRAVGIADQIRIMIIGVEPETRNEIITRRLLRDFFFLGIEMDDPMRHRICNFLYILCLIGLVVLRYRVLLRIHIIAACAAYDLRDRHCVVFLCIPCARQRGVNLNVFLDISVGIVEHDRIDNSGVLSGIFPFINTDALIQIPEPLFLHCLFSVKGKSV